MNAWEIAGRTLEYIDDGHIYLVDGIVVPSITTILKKRFGGMYDGISPEVLNKAAERGTAIHAGIEAYCKTGAESDWEEVRGFKWLQGQYDFSVKDCEVPVILFDDGEPIAAGRCDLVVECGGKIGGADIKTTSTLQKEYVAYQLNAYRMAYFASYGVEWEFLWAVHLKSSKRKITPLPIDEKKTKELIKEYMDEYHSIDR